MHGGIHSERPWRGSSPALLCWMLCNQYSLPPKPAIPPGDSRFSILELELQAAPQNRVEQQECLAPIGVM